MDCQRNSKFSFIVAIIGTLYVTDNIIYVYTDGAKSDLTTVLTAKKRNRQSNRTTNGRFIWTCLTLLSSTL